MFSASSDVGWVFQYQVLLDGFCLRRLHLVAILLTVPSSGGGPGFLWTFEGSGFLWTIKGWGGDLYHFSGTRVTHFHLGPA